MKRQRLAGEAGLARIDGRCVAVGGGDASVEQTSLSERRGEAAAGGVDIMMIHAGESAGSGERVELRRIGAMLGPEERPVEMLARRTASERGGHGRSVSREGRLALRREGLEGAPEIAGRHADRLRLRFRLDHLVDPHRPFLVEHGLGHAMREPWAVGQRSGDLMRLGLERLGADARHCRSPSARPSSAESERPV